MRSLVDSAAAGDASVAIITAGWQEREGEDEGLRRALDLEPPVVLSNLRLFERREAVFDEDNEVFLALRDRRRRLHELQRLHRLRLDPLLSALRRLQEETPRAHDPGGELLAGELDSALDVVRSLDQHHLGAVEAVRASVDGPWLAPESSVLEHHRAEVAEILAGTETVVITGGHVETLLECLRLFDLGAALEARNLVVWSAGAMALSPLVLLFHDHPPWGAGNAEVLDRGLGILDGLLPLPHARWRLRLQDTRRVGVLARRVAPLLPMVLEEESHLELRSDGWWGSNTACLEADGSLRSIGAAAESLVAS
jgi:hypothetical protein